MPKLSELAKLIRSKNAGPFQLTFDIMFDDSKVYRKVKSSEVINKKLIAQLYDIAEDDVFCIACDNALAFKITIPRPTFSGDLGDPDVFGGQQYAPLSSIEIPVTTSAKI